MDRLELIKKIIKKVTTGKADSLKNMKGDVMKLDFAANINYEYIQDNEILWVKDVPIAKEMVQPYSDGMHFKPADAIERINVEFSPISVMHPSKQFFDMTDEEKKEHIIGYQNGGYFKDNKKFTDFFFFVDKTPKNVIDYIEGGESIDVSIGFKVDYDETPGDFEGEHYDVIQKNIYLDHTAVLPDAVGRASFQQGVGIGADSNIKKEAGTMAEKELVDALKEAGEYKTKLHDSEMKLKDSEKELADSKKEVEKLTDEAKKFDEFKVKADKYDVAMTKAKEDEVTKVTDLKKKILDSKKSRTDDKFKKFIEGQDSSAELQFILDDLESTNKTLPGKKKDEKDTGEDIADPAMKKLADDYAKANDGEKLINL